MAIRLAIRSSRCWGHASSAFYEARMFLPGSGGDEFGIVLKDSNVDYAEAVAKRVLTRLEEPSCSGWRACTSVPASASHSCPSTPKEATELLRCADVAMYRAKLARRPFDVYQA